MTSAKSSRNLEILCYQLLCLGVIFISFVFILAQRLNHKTNHPWGGGGGTWHQDICLVPHFREKRKNGPDVHVKHHCRNNVYSPSVYKPWGTTCRFLVTLQGGRVARNTHHPVTDCMRGLSESSYHQQTVAASWNMVNTFHAASKHNATTNLGWKLCMKYWCTSNTLSSYTTP
jgi:hypothetical protein